MTQTQNEIKLAAIEAQIASTKPEQVHLYSALLGIRHLREEGEAKALKELTWQMTIVPSVDVNDSSSICEARDCGNKYSFSFARESGGYRELAELAQLDAALAVLERHPDMPAAIATLEPLCTERGRLREAIAAEKAAHNAAYASACDAEREATTKALAAVENDPSVIAARKALAKFEDPEVPLTRGKQSLASAAA
jgi:hypothetical protein